MNVWVDCREDNIQKVKRALITFGSPFLFAHTKPREIPQLGLAPNRIDILLEAEPITFANAWQTRIEGKYGASPANWIDIDNLICIKQSIDKPKHQEDARILRRVKELNEEKQN